MSQAIHYLNQSCNQSDEQDSNQNRTALETTIPTQAVTIAVDEILDKNTLLTNLAAACDFPSYFSHNWDSAWDCLTDSDVTHLMLDLTSVQKINTEDFNMFKQLIEDAYREFGKPQLWIMVSSGDSL